MKYEPTWDSIDTRPVPTWFEDAKFGIFIHWGLYSVPGYTARGGYAEWYGAHIERVDALRGYHARTWGQDFAYRDFAPLFTCGLFDPDQWADLFVRSGARYVVPTSRHHDGFCLWPSRFAPNWNSVDTGPHRDLLGDLLTSVRAKGLKGGLYYSLYEWYSDLYRDNVAEYVEKHTFPQLKEVVEAYEPALLFTDGERDHNWRVWRAPEFLAWLFNESSCRDEVAVNDRWGRDTRSVHGGYYTTEYGTVCEGTELRDVKAWEECRGIGASFGYNRNETADDYMTATQIIHLLVDLVSRGGNLLLNVGPTADGRIPPIMEDRLLRTGEWLTVNGEAIYGTRRWKASTDPRADFVRYTSKDGVVYATCLRWPGDELVLSAPVESGVPRVTMLSDGRSLDCGFRDGDLHIAPRLLPSEVQCTSAWSMRIENIT
jgi:alpha-L-fucosidase